MSVKSSGELETNVRYSVETNDIWMCMAAVNPEIYWNYLCGMYSEMRFGAFYLWWEMVRDKKVWVVSRYE